MTRAASGRDDAMRWGIATCVLLAGCGPWRTPIPTYWDAVSSPVAQGEQRAAPPVVIEPTPPPAEAPPSAPAEETSCTAVYVITAERRMLAYHPGEGRFEAVGTLRCPSPGEPSSMAVARDGTAQVLYTTGEVFDVTLDGVDCAPTAYDPSQPPGYRRFGMGYAFDPAALGESLFIAEISRWKASEGLLRLDRQSGRLSFIGRFSANPGHGIELTPGPKGGLWGYFLDVPGPGGTLVEIDPSDATVLSSRAVPVGHAESALAVAWWEGAFHLFTTDRQGRTLVHAFDLETGSLSEGAQLDLQVVGAGVSTCAGEAPGGGWRALDGE